MIVAKTEKRTYVRRWLKSVVAGWRAYKTDRAFYLSRGKEKPYRTFDGWV